MKFNFSSKSRIAVGIIVAAVVVTGSIGAISFAANDMNPVHKDVLISETETKDSAQESNYAQTIIDSQGTIEYTKSTHTITENDKFSDEESFIAETWLDPNTLENREDCKIISGENNFTAFHSTYQKNNGSNIITIERDQKGYAVSGTITKVPQETADKNFSSRTKLNTFASIKERSSLPVWKDEGTQKTPDGKELKKLSQTYMCSNPDNVQVKTNLLYYVDTTTGFPVKEELYQDINGTMELIWYDIYEYKYINNDGKLFDTSGVELKETSFNR